MALLDEVLSSLSGLSKDNLRNGQYSPGSRISDPIPINESVLAHIPAFKPDETVSIDPVPARQV